MTPSAAAFPCCRAHDLFGPIETYGDAIKRSLADEVYWFNWVSSFDGEATIRVARLEAEAMVFGTYRPSHFGKRRQRRASMSMADWALFEDALVAANFWNLDRNGGHHGLDGANWSLAGSRNRDYHFISRWSPDDALWDLGRLFFDLAGLDRVRLG